MKLKTYITIIVIALLLFGVVRAASAQDIVAGVAPGNEFTYSVTGSYPSDNPNVPQEVINAHATDYYKVVIDNVTGPEIGYKWSWHFTNGTDPQNGNGSVNIETTADSGGFWAIVSANLMAGARIHPHFGLDLSTFNETVLYAYSNYTRETNRLEQEFVYQNNVTQATKTEHWDTYFDKQTGMLAQLNEQTDYQNPAFTTVITWKLIEQNVWTYSSPGSFPPEPFFSLPVIAAIVVVVAIVVIIVGVVVSNKRKAARRKKLFRKK